MARWKSYGEYLKSDEWAKLRYQALLRDNFKCKRCGNAADDVHHLVYSRWSEERVENLASMCKKHHDELHEINGTETQHRHLMPTHSGGQLDIKRTSDCIEGHLSDRDGLIFQFYVDAEDYHNHCSDFLREEEL